MDEVNKAAIKEKKCKYFDKGYCKYKLECKFAHSGEICKTHLEGRKCKENSCKDRHPKVCKWWMKGGCRRTDCEYLHVTLIHDDDKQNEAHKYFPCYGCKNCFDDRTCVVQNGTIFLCHNCDSRIHSKGRTELWHQVGVSLTRIETWGGTYRRGRKLSFGTKTNP